MRADYSELCYFLIGNSYPYIDLKNINNNSKPETENNNSQVLLNAIPNLNDEISKTMDVSQALNIPIKTEIKVLSKATDYSFKLHDAYLVYQQTGRVLEVLIHFYEEAISDIIFYFGLKGTVGGLVLSELLSAVPREVSKKTVVILGLFLAADYKLNPYISKSFSNLLQEYNIPLLSIPYMLKRQSDIANLKKQPDEEVQRFFEEHEYPNLNYKISIEDVIFNMEAIR